jgi:hypothetical protein
MPFSYGLSQPVVYLLLFDSAYCHTRYELSPEILKYGWVQM